MGDDRGPAGLFFDAAEVHYDAANQGHVQLDRIGLDRREALEPGVALAQVVDGDAIALLAQAGLARSKKD